MEHVQVSGFHPMDARIDDLDQENRMRRPVGKTPQACRLSARPYGVRADNGHVAGHCWQSARVAWAAEFPDVDAGQLAIVWAVPGLVEVVRLVEVVSLHVRQNQDPPTVHRTAVFIRDIGRGKAAVLVVIVVQRHSEAV